MMIRTSVTGIILLIAGFIYSQEPPVIPAGYPEKILRIDSFFMDKIGRDELAGAITLIARNGQVIHEKSYGYADKEIQLPLDAGTIIPVASMTKVITSVAVLKLSEDGMLSLDDPVDLYIPAFRDIKVLAVPDSDRVGKPLSKPTIRDFLRHTSGMTYGAGNTLTDRLYRESGFRTWDGTLSGFVDRVAGIPLAFQPATRWEYSYSYDVLGFLVERISGLPLDRFCRDRIFGPLGMNDTGFHVPEEKSGCLSDLYVFKDGKLEIDDNRDSSVYCRLPRAISGGGGWWSPYGGVVTTVRDYHIFLEMLLNYGCYQGITILEKNTVARMITNQIAHLNACKYQYGLGVGIDPSPHRKEIFWSGSPYNTYFWIDYEEHLIGILFTNTAPSGHLDMMNRFHAMVYSN